MKKGRKSRDSVALTKNEMYFNTHVRTTNADPDFTVPSMILVLVLIISITIYFC